MPSTIEVRSFGSDAHPVLVEPAMHGVELLAPKLFVRIGR